MLSKKMQDAMNDQIQIELGSAYIYLSMAAYFDSVNLMGFSHWFKMQAQEEMFHAMKFYNHIAERGGTVELLAIKKPQKKWESPLKAFQDALKHEEYITGCINSLVEVAQKEKDFAASNLLIWFIDEQVEEEASVGEIVEKLKMMKGQSHMLYMLDKELGARQASTNPFLKEEGTE